MGEENSRKERGTKVKSSGQHKWLVYSPSVIGDVARAGGPKGQSQEYQLAMPLMRSAALLFRRWVSVSERHVSRLGQV